MSGPLDELRSLREALAVSPDNPPLLRLLAEALLRQGRPAEAEPELRRALELCPRDPELKTALARAFFQQGKSSQAAALLEVLCASDAAPPRARVLHARLLLQSGECEQARAEYARALKQDPGAAEEDLDERLGGARPARQGEAEEEEKARLPAGETPGADAELELERPRGGFADVGGMERVKEEIRMKIIHPLRQPEIFRAYGKRAGGGILLFGPPGCGKTHLARATAAEVQAAFLTVGLHEILDLYLGQSERNLHAIFEQARAHAPCVLFLDEVDALGASRSDMRHSAGRTVINQLLAEMDGAQSANEELLILAATNAPWHMDAALRRPGRFDRQIFVPPPDEAARAEILRIHLRGKPKQDVDAAEVARRCPDFSGADLMAVVDQAVEARLAAALRAGAPQPLRTKDLLAAAKQVRPSTREWFSTARNHALYANQAGLYDEILEYLKLK